MAGVFKINVIDSYVCLTEVDHLKDNDDLVTIKTEFKDFMQKWTTCKAEVPQRLQGGWSLAYMSSQAEVEAFRAKLYIELRQLALVDETPPLGELLVPQFKPNCLRAAVDLSKGDICIYPVVTSITQIYVKPTDGCYTVTVKAANKVNLTFYLGCPPMPRVSDSSKWRPEEAINPAKLLLEETNDSMVNIAQKIYLHTAGGANFTIPYFENTKALKKNEKLFVKKVLKRTLSSAP